MVKDGQVTFAWVNNSPFRGKRNRVRLGWTNRQRYEGGRERFGRGNRIRRGVEGIVENKPTRTRTRLTRHGAAEEL